MDLLLKDRAIVITGAAGGIGQACAIAFASEGARVLAADVNVGELERLAGAHPGLIHTRRVDVSQPGEVAELFSEADRLFGTVDSLVTAAGAYHWAPIQDIRLEDWERIQSVNLRGSFLCAQAAFRRMTRQGSGSIVLIASLAGRSGGVYAGVDYAASKGGVIALSKALAKQGAAGGVRVNCISPGVIDTQMTRRFPSEVRDSIADQHPMKRWGRVDEVVPFILLLASPLGSYVTGAEIDISGGAQI